MQSGELRFLLLRFFHSSISRTMGCFSACFRSRDRDLSHRRPPILATKPTDTLTSRNRLSSLFLAEEREGTPQEDRGRCTSGSPEVRKNLRDEAKFLKSRGTLPETPKEIRDNSAKLRSSTAKDKTSTSEFWPSLSNASPKKLGIEKQPERAHTPTKLRDIIANDVDSPELTPNSCITNTRDIGSGSINSSKRADDESSYVADKVHMIHEENAATPITPSSPASSTHNRNKTAHFECVDNIHSFRGDRDEDYKESQSLENQTLRRSAIPTPLKVSDDMQTPDTVYPIPSDDSHVMPWKATKEDETNIGQVSLEKTNYDERKLGRGSGKDLDEVKVEVGLSEWLKPPVPRHEPRIGKTIGERPIIGLVATHWNESLLIEASPPKKGWDGNGIPNSTNKYKEDQKVNWHATTFEERLEKALSEETFSQRNQVKEGSQVGLNEEDEDTAASNLHRSGPFKSTVSV